MTEYGTAPATAVDDMPNTNSTMYRGIAAYSSEYSDPADIAQYAETLSQLELNANFATSSMTGRAYNFKSVDPNITIDGQIDVTGTISGNTFAADVDGTTKEAAYGQSGNVTYNGTVNGEFVGSNAQAVRGSGYAVGSEPGYQPFPVWIVWGAEK